MSQASSLERTTQDYWLISRAWNGRRLPTDTPIDTQTGLSVLTQIELSAIPNKKVFYLAANLRSDIIMGKASSRSRAV